MNRAMPGSPRRIVLLIVCLFACGLLLRADATAGLKKINDTELYCRVIGKGEPLVIVHGGPGLGHDYLFSPFQPLAERFRLIFFDQRGCGRSVALAEGTTLTMDQLVADLDSVRLAYGLERMNLVGQSWGALIACEYTVKYPRRVRSLLLLEPAPGSSAYLASFQKTIMDRLSTAEKEELSALTQSEEFKQGAPQAFKRFMAIRNRAYYFDPQFIPEDPFAYFDAERVKKFFASSQAVQEYLLNFDIYEKVTAITCPTLIIHGLADPVPAEAMRRLHVAIPQSVLHLVKECGHYVHIEKPNLYLMLINFFMNSVLNR